MGDIVIASSNLPSNIEDLSKFVLVGRERLNAVRAMIRAIDKVDMASEVYQQKLAEGQEIGEAVLDAEVRLGELRKAVQRNSGGNHGNQYTSGKIRSVADFGNPLQDFDNAIRSSADTAKRFEKLAEHPDIVERVKAEARDDGRIVTRQDVLKAITDEKRAAVTAKREERRQANAAKIDTYATPLDATGLFQTIVIDPPWDWGDEGDGDKYGRTMPDYATMPIDEIEQLPVGKIADDNCHLYLWITNRSLYKGFRLLDAWGFRYITCLTWVKPSFGMGTYFRGDTEQVLFGVKGNQPIKRHDVGTHFNAPRGNGHSAKPDEFYQLVETCSYGPYIDIFGRKGREGWSVWGENG